MLFLVSVVPLGLATLFDDRLVNGISAWIKLVKFLASLAIYYATLAWFYGFLPERVREARLGRFLVYVPIGVGLLEMTWLVVTAALGQPSHFNRSSPAFGISYALAGVGATTLMLVVLTMGISIARHRDSATHPALRLAVVLGCVTAFVATMVTAGYLASGSGHWVGGTSTDAGGLPFVGWSRTGGDLRVAHFWAMHALQVVPFLGFIAVRSGVRKPRVAVSAVTAGYVAFIAFTFVQALQGRPFL